MKHIQPSEALEHGLELFRASPFHKYYTVEDLYTYLQLPIKHGKFRLYYDNGKPVGIITWCWMTTENADAFLQEAYHPTEDDYQYDAPGVKELWGMEFIAPYGHTRQMMRAIKHSIQQIHGPQKVNWRRTHSRDKRRAKRFHT